MDDQGENGCTLKNRSILLGITGSIAAFKVAGWASTMVQEGGNVSVMMTESSTRFVSSLTFAALTSNQVVTDMFGEGEDEAMAHITLSRSVDAVLIAPATAQTIARLAHGMADDLISTAVLASEAPVVVCPAMNSRMLAHPATQRNINILKELGYFIVKPDSGMLACGEEGSGRLPEWDRVREELLGLFVEKDFLGRKVLITAGPTREPIDPARYLSNRSSGKMGYALARVARRRGGRVTLVSGPVNLAPPPDVECVNVLT
ncbi:MAG: bifunctional phosphopantothenoylcysteine decarboxylase/phosphopantothenate--cysteine ligase CoaBC, partial [Desulfobulbus sp.]